MGHIDALRQEARRLNDMGETLRRQRKYPEAERSFHDALALYERIGPSGLLGKAVCRDNLGTLYAETMRFPEALDEHWAALEIFEQAGGRHLDLAICANNLGMVFRLLENYVAAEHYFEWALTLHQQLSEPSLDFVGLLINLAATKYLRGEPALAESLLQQALNMCASFGSDAADMRELADASLSAIRGTASLDSTPSTLNGALARAVALAREEFAAGRAEAAALPLQELLDPAAIKSEPTDMVLEEARALLAAAYEATRRVSESASLLRANADSEMERMRRGAATAARRDLLDLFEANSPHFLNLLGHCARHNTDQESLDHTYSLWVERRDIWLSTLGSWAVLDTSDHEGELADLIVRRQRLMDQLAADDFSTSDMVVMDSGEFAARYGRRLATRTEVADLERRIAVRIARRQPAPQSRASISDVRAALEEGSLLIDVVRGCPSANFFVGEADMHYAAFAINPSSGPQSRLVKLGALADVDSAVEAVLRVGSHSNAVRDAEVPQSVAADGNFDAARENLARLVANLASVSGHAEKLLLLLDGSLQFVPFDVLPWDESADWMDRFQLSQLSTLRRVLPHSRSKTPSAGPPLVVAAPDFDFPSGSGHPYAPLPGAYDEGREVASRLGVPLIAGRDATKLAVVTTRSPLVLHVATHGFFSSRDRVHSIQHETGVGLASADFTDPEFERLARLAGTLGAEPLKSATLTDLSEDRGDLDTGLLNCGLAFAGANAERATRQHAHPQSARNLTELFGAEIARMDLSGTELVVLTACDAGRGDARPGSAGWGFPLAFAIAGAQSIVFSVWKVDDSAALALMKAFYDGVLAGETPASSLRSAKKALRAQGLHVSRWGGFICMDGLQPVTRSLTTHGASAV